MLADSADLPRISVVTPSYNHGRFLKACITSVLDQKYPALEYIMVDGGSTDKSLRIIKRHKGQIARWVSEPDEGQSDAVNKGIQMSTGQIVAWLNADDYYLPGALKTVADAFNKNPEASFYFGDGIRVNEDGQPVSGFWPERKMAFNREGLVFGLNFILQPACFINRSHLNEVGLLDTSLHYGLDTDLWIRLSGIAEPMAIPARLAASREYEKTKTATGSFVRVEELRQIAERYSGLPMTPGALLYYLDTLRSFSLEREDVFPSSFREQLERLQLIALDLLKDYGEQPDGFPAPSDLSDRR